MNLEQIKADAEALNLSMGGRPPSSAVALKNMLSDGYTHATANHVANCDPQTILKLLEVVESADNYYRRYCQDEAAETGPEDTGCTLAQHEDALSLRDALAALGVP